MYNVVLVIAWFREQAQSLTVRHGAVTYCAIHSDRVCLMQRQKREAAEAANLSTEAS
jgi:hypothetical protein